MAWEYTLLDASFRGVPFDCLETEDSASRAVASHEYPYLDGADVEDLGRKARTVKITAFFHGDSYESRLQTLLAVLDQGGTGELIHPVFGSIKDALPTGYTISHKGETPDSCTVVLNFTEATPGNPFFVRQLPLQLADVISLLMSAAFGNGAGAFSSVFDTLKGIKNNLARLNALRSVLTGTLSNIRSQISGVIGTTLDMIDYPRAFASDVVGMMRGMAEQCGFGRGAVLSDWKSLVRQFDGVVQLPARVAAGTVSTTAGSSSSGSAAANAAVQPVGAHADDVALVTAMVRVAASTALAETAGQIFAAEAEQPTLSPQEIEQISNDVRESLQASIDAWRDLLPVETARPVTESLKDAALGVQRAAVSVIDVLPPLVTRRVEAPGNLHLLAFRWYGDYSRASELARLNPTLINPNGLQTGDTLNAYAR